VADPGTGGRGNDPSSFFFAPCLSIPCHPFTALPCRKAAPLNPALGQRCNELRYKKIRKMLNLNKHIKRHLYLKQHVNLHVRTDSVSVRRLYHCSQLSFTIRHRTILIIFSPNVQTISLSPVYLQLVSYSDINADSSVMAMQMHVSAICHMIIMTLLVSAL